MASAMESGPRHAYKCGMLQGWGDDTRICTCGLAALVEKAAKWDAFVSASLGPNAVNEPQHGNGCLCRGQFDECDCGLASLRADAAKWRAINEGKGWTPEYAGQYLELLTRDAARFRKIEAAVENGASIAMWPNKPGSFAVSHHSPDKAPDGYGPITFEYAPTLAAAVDSLPALPEAT